MAGLEDRQSDFDLKDTTRTVVFQPHHQLMARPRQREVDLKPQRIFFYKRVIDDKILAFTEQEADMMLKSSHAPFLRQLGVSDGTTYMKFIRESGLKVGDVVSVKKAEEILAGAFNAELEAARGHFDDPTPHNVHFDASYPVKLRPFFQPPADE